MVSRVRRSRTTPCPARDLRAGAKMEFQSLEDSIRAFYRGGEILLPESRDGDYEFPEAVGADALRSPDIAPTNVDKLDMAAEINAEQYNAVFRKTSAAAESQAAAESAAQAAAQDPAQS